MELPPIKPPLPLLECNVANYLFNGMINPLIPYGIQGVIWYQGENNCARAKQYKTTFSLLIQDWRNKWGQGDFPFYFCQLPNHMISLPTPAESNWAELRESQSAALSLPHTAQAVLIDVGEEGNIHPADKKVVGDRLAKIALVKTYEKKMICSGPVYESFSREGSQIIIHFKEGNGELKSKSLPKEYKPLSNESLSKPLLRNTPDSELEGFSICGTDHKWIWAQAKIEGKTVIVWNSQIKDPIAVRYAWANNPICNLVNEENLPAAPFRTDEFPGITDKETY
ncbi:MAG: sialate O-acetylesterase [Verrucomicrobiota bacterium]